MKTSIKQKIFIERCKIVEGYGVLELISDHYKNIFALICLNLLIWCSVAGLLSQKRVIILHPSMVYAADVVRADVEESTVSQEAVVSAQRANDTAIEEKESTPTPQEQTVETIKLIAKNKGFSNVDGLLRLAHCESRFYKESFNPTNNSNDRGLFQISRKWHPEVSDEQAYSVEYSTSWTIDMINKGQVNQWMCSHAFNDETYKI